MISFDRGATKATRFWQAVWALSFLTLAIVAGLLRPNPDGHGTHTQLGLPPCPSVLIFHRPCPGCGMTTSFAHMAHGNVAGAFSSHPFGPVAFFLWGFSALAAGYATVRGLRFNTESRAFQWCLAIFAVAFFGYGVIRFQMGFSDGTLHNPVVQATPR